MQPVYCTNLIVFQTTTPIFSLQFIGFIKKKKGNQKGSDLI